MWTIKVKMVTHLYYINITSVPGLLLKLPIAMKSCSQDIFPVVLFTILRVIRHPSISLTKGFLCSDHSEITRYLHYCWSLEPFERTTVSWSKYSCLQLRSLWLQSITMLKCNRMKKNRFIQNLAKISIRSSLNFVHVDDTKPLHTLHYALESSYYQKKHYKKHNYPSQRSKSC